MTTDTAIEALTKAAEAFREYARSHQEKARQSHDKANWHGHSVLGRDQAARDAASSEQKATRNRILAEQMEAALSTLIVPKTYEMGVEDAALLAIESGNAEDEDMADSDSYGDTRGREWAEQRQSKAFDIAAAIRTLTNPGGNNG